MKIYGNTIKKRFLETETIVLLKKLKLKRLNMCFKEVLAILVMNDFKKNLEVYILEFLGELKKKCYLSKLLKIYKLIGQFELTAWYVICL